MNTWNSYPDNFPLNEGEYIVTKFGFVTHNRYHKVGSPIIKTEWFCVKTPFNQSIIAWSKGDPYDPKESNPQFIGKSKWRLFPQEKPISKDVYLTTSRIGNEQHLMALIYYPENEDSKGTNSNYDLLDLIDGPVHDPWENVIAWVKCNPYDPTKPDPQYL